MSFYAQIIEDSHFNAGGKYSPRLTTMQLRFPRFIHCEFMTHRMFSRNASSSRAIPVAKMLQAVEEDPAMPVYWGKNQPGMQAREELTGPAREACEKHWLKARDEAVERVKQMADLGLHKQVANRILEPWMHISVIVTATDWSNFFALRCHADAQPEIRELALQMRAAYNKSYPTVRGEHLPYVTASERALYKPEVARKLSVARCARVSYNNHDGTSPDVQKDIELHDRLAESGHWSPFEHQATAVYALNGFNEDSSQYEPSYEYIANFRGWKQYRKEFAKEYTP